MTEKPLVSRCERLSDVRLLKLFLKSDKVLHVVGITRTAFAADVFILPALAQISRHITGFFFGFFFKSPLSAVQSETLVPNLAPLLITQGK